MVGSPLIAGYLAHAAFWILLAYGWARDELTLGRMARFLVLWLVGRIGLPLVPYESAPGMFAPWVAVLDVALVFLIFRGDVRLK